MLDSKEKSLKNLSDPSNNPAKIPRTFVFDQNIPEEQYHLFIDPEEYYNEEFDTCKDEFQNYRTSIQKKRQLQKNLQKIRPQHHNIRLCSQTQSSKRPQIPAFSDSLTQMNRTDGFFSNKVEGNETNFNKIMGDSTKLLGFSEKNLKSLGKKTKNSLNDEELSQEIRVNDKTQIMLEKTKRAIRRNEIECEKLKRKVNDGSFFDKLLINLLGN